MFNIFSNRKRDAFDVSILAQTISKDKDWPKKFAKCFSSSEGKEVLAYIKFLALEKTLGPDATSEALFYHEGRRSFFTTIMTLVKQGRGDL